jgi:hypothetical protein
MPIVVTQAYTGNARVRIPTELRTIGDHNLPRTGPSGGQHPAGAQLK